MSKWAPSCNVKYSQGLDRLIRECIVSSEAVQNVRRYRIEDNALMETVKLTPVLLATISRYNSNMSPAQCSEALARGERVYTSFSYYMKEDIRW